MLREKIQDRVRKSVICPTCKKLLCKIDEDGTIHIRPNKGPAVIVSAGSRVMFSCEAVTYMSTKNPNDPRIKDSPTDPTSQPNGAIVFGVACGARTLIAEGCHA